MSKTSHMNQESKDRQKTDAWDSPNSVLCKIY